MAKLQLMMGQQISKTTGLAQVGLDHRIAQQQLVQEAAAQVIVLPGGRPARNDALEQAIANMRQHALPPRAKYAKVSDILKQAR